MKWWDWYWTVLISVGLILFLAVEIPAVATGHPERTLSWWVWSKLERWVPGSIGAWTPYHWAVSIVLLLLFAWLAVHFAFGWLR